MILFYCLYFCVYYQNQLLEEYLFNQITSIGFTSILDWKNKIVKRSQGRRVKILITDVKDINDNTPTSEEIAIVRNIDTLMKYIFEIKLNGLNNTSTLHSMEFYHLVFYQAIDGQLRIVSDQILGKLKEIYLRDKDAILFIKNRDFKIIEKSFEKKTSSILPAL